MCTFFLCWSQFDVRYGIPRQMKTQTRSVPIWLKEMGHAHTSGPNCGAMSLWQACAVGGHNAVVQCPSHKPNTYEITSRYFFSSHLSPIMLWGILNNNVRILVYHISFGVMWCLAGRYTIQSKLERKITEPFRQLPLLLTLYGPASITSLSLTALCSVVFPLLVLPLSRLLA
jgi:hypothetical protein